MVTCAPIAAASLTPMWPSPPRPDDRDLGALADLVLAERRVGGDAGAQQGRDARLVHAVGHLEHEMVADDDMVGVAALGDLAVVAVGAVVGLGAALAAEHFPALEALVAGHAAVDHAADRDDVADLVPGDLGADRGDLADDLVARDDRVAGAVPVVAAVWRSRVADAGVGDADGDIVGAERRGARSPSAAAAGRGRRCPSPWPSSAIRFARSSCPGSVQSSLPWDSPVAARCRTRRAWRRCGRSTIRPPTDSTPALGSASNAATIASAWAMSSADGREGGVDHRDLVGVDGELAGEAFARGGLGFGAKPVCVAEVGEDAVDRLDPGGDRAGEAQASAPAGR